MNNLNRRFASINLSKERGNGKIQIYTGDGKGKTTASLGLCIRALGRNKKVAIVYFDKGGDNYGERKILDKLVDSKIQYFVFGSRRFNAESKAFRFGVTNKDKHEAEMAIEKAKELFLDPALDLLVLDEINSAISSRMIKLETVMDLVAIKPEKLELVLTGRGAPKKLINASDLVTEMKLIKHYFYSGQEAREGIEY